MTVPVLTLDGPSGSGKGTIGQTVAVRLGWHYLDSGAVYRALAHVLSERKITDPKDPRVAAVARELDLECRPNLPESAAIWANGRDVSERIRDEDCGRMASKVAAEPAVRAALLALQRRARRAPGLVADGRDMGTAVFPDAQLKIYLTASPKVRAKRRYNQLKLKGFDVNLASLSEAIQARDARDSERPASPLRTADDAVLLDTSGLTIEETVSQVLNLIETKLVVERVDMTRTH
ncbi:MAG: (d)CMP kinase [Gammaproteobacteria bacterium]|nr:(d)CMP kinase [Gammaproteobacteria bacterium]